MHCIPGTPLTNSKCGRSLKAPDADYTAWLITGDGQEPDNQPFYYCRVEREDNSASGCGIDAKFFEPSAREATANP